MNYNRGDVVIVPFPFVTERGARQKARPALVISDHSIKRRYNDLILVGITSRVETLHPTEFLIGRDSKDFKQSGLAKSSMVRCEYIMTLPPEIISRKLGALSKETMTKIDRKLKQSLGIK